MDGDSMADTSYNGNQEPAHKRRVRYKGTHPRSYKEKYKELQPEKYADTVATVSYTHLTLPTKLEV